MFFIEKLKAYLDNKKLKKTMNMNWAEKKIRKKRTNPFHCTKHERGNQKKRGWRMAVVQVMQLFIRGEEGEEVMLMKRDTRVDGVKEEFHEDITHLAEQK